MSQDDFIPLLFHVNMKMSFSLAVSYCPEIRKKMQRPGSFRVSVFPGTFLAEFAAKLWVGLMLWNRKMAAAAATIKGSKNSSCGYAIPLSM